MKTSENVENHEKKVNKQFSTRLQTNRLSKIFHICTRERKLTVLNLSSLWSHLTMYTNFKYDEKF